MKSTDKRVRIIKAATKIFATKGFFNARISDIAKQAKVADGTIYLYFNNKFNILLTILEQEIGDLIDKVTEQLVNETYPPKMLEIFAINHLTKMKKNRYLAHLIQVELRQSNKAVRDYRNKDFLEYLDILKDIIIQGQERKIYRSDINPEIAKYAIWGALDEMSMSLKLDEIKTLSIEEISHHNIKLFSSGMLERTS